MPAMAKVTMSGMIVLDTYYVKDSKESVANQNVINSTRQGVNNPYDSRGNTYFDLYQPLNRIGMKYESDDKNIGGYIEIRGGGADTGSTFSWYYAWIDWHFTKDTYLRVGRQTQAFAVQAPDIGVGATIVPSLLFGFGNIHGGSSRDAVRLYTKFNDMVRLELQALDPDSENAAITGVATELTLPRVPVAQGGPGGNAQESSVIPRFDVSLPIHIANFVFEPSATWLRQQYDQVAAGSDDNFDIWGVCLFADANFGPLLFRGEITYGQNLADGNYVGASPGAVGTPGPIGRARTYVDAAGNTKVADTDILSWWAELGYRFGPATLYGVVGMQNLKNDLNPAIARANDGANDFDVTRWAYGMRLAIDVAKGFKVIPEVVYYDSDDSAEIGGSAATVDFGSETMAGVRFQLSF